jgi:hypothetical protein
VRCLSVRQPLAYAICRGWKRVENRSRATPFTGPILIHAGKARYPWQKGDRFLDGHLIPDPASLPFGAIIGQAVILGCVAVAEDGAIIGDAVAPPAVRRLNDVVFRSPYSAGPYCWVLSEAVMFAKPVLWTGQLGLFEVPGRWRAS